jgi:ribosomal protein S4
MNSFIFFLLNKKLNNVYFVKLRYLVLDYFRFKKKSSFMHNKLTVSQKPFIKGIVRRRYLYKQFLQFIKTEKKKLNSIYGYLTIKQLKKYLNSYGSLRGFLVSLESRLDIILVRSGFVETIHKARQIILHGFVCVNYIQIFNYNFRIKKGMLVTVNINLYSSLVQYKNSIVRLKKDYIADIDFVTFKLNSFYKPFSKIKFLYKPYLFYCLHTAKFSFGGFNKSKHKFSFLNKDALFMSKYNAKKVIKKKYSK